MSALYTTIPRYPSWIIILSYECCTAVFIAISCNFVSFKSILLTAFCQLKIKRIYINTYYIFHALWFV